MSLEIGEMAPDFTLPSTNKQDITLSDFRGNKNVLIMFYPLNFTPVWIKELSSWKEEYSKLEEQDTEVLGISCDHIFSQNVFEASLGTLPYPLLADWHKKIVKDYHVFNEKDEIAIRSCFLVDKEGRIAFKNTSFDAEDKTSYKEIIKICGRL